MTRPEALPDAEPAGALAPAVEVRDLTVRYGRGSRALSRPPAVERVSFDIAPGETLGLVGESGSGKSTIGKALLGLQRPSSGVVRLHGTDITSATLAERRTLAADLRAVFQDPYSSLNPARTIGQTLAEPLRVLGIRADRARERARGALESVGLPADAVDRYPSQFSGGQRQRIAIARALVCDPKVVILDEPVSALDLSTQATVLNLLADLRDQRGLSYLFISHDLSVVRFLAQRVIVLYQGRVMESGDVSAVTQRPRHPYTIALTMAAPVPSAREQAARRAAREAFAVGAAGTVAASGSGCRFVRRCPFATEVCSAEAPEERPFDGRLAACHHLDRVAASRRGEVQPA